MIQQLPETLFIAVTWRNHFCMTSSDSCIVEEPTYLYTVAFLIFWYYVLIHQTSELKGYVLSLYVYFFCIISWPERIRRTLDCYDLSLKVFSHIRTCSKLKVSLNTKHLQDKHWAVWGALWFWYSVLFFSLQTCTCLCVLWYLKTFLPTLGEEVLQHNSPHALTPEKLEITCFLSTLTCGFFVCFVFPSGT